MNIFYANVVVGVRVGTGEGWWSVYAITSPAVGRKQEHDRKYNVAIQRKKTLDRPRIRLIGGPDRRVGCYDDDVSGLPGDSF